MKLAYMTTYNYKDIKNWSGLGYYIGQTLENQSDNLYYIEIKGKYLQYLPIFLEKTILNKYIFHKNYLREREPYVLKHYAFQAMKKLSRIDIDLIFSPGTLPVAYLETKKPIVFWTDATFVSMLDFYPAFTNLCENSIKNGHLIEKLALDKCTLAIYSSEWAANSAIEYYNIDESKVKVVPFGANIDSSPSLSEVNKMIESRSIEKCKLLFIGVDWKRKGGEIAYDVAKKLNMDGINTELNIVGCKPDLRGKDNSFINNYGFLDKSKVKDSAIFNKLIAESHFLILPTQAEAYGLVFCEANAFGVPCIATDVGGISTIIKNNLNGKTFDKDSNYEVYCEYLSSLMRNYSNYKKLALSSYNEYITRLNWNIAGKKVIKLLEDII